MILTSKAEFYPQFSSKCHIMLMAFNDDCVLHGLNSVWSGISTGLKSKKLAFKIV